MTKIISLLFSGLLILSVQSAVAKEQATQAAPEKSQYTYDVDENYNFDENSFYISDEQMKDAQEIEKIEQDTTLESKIINSSHFSSGTATKTYIPINKNK